MNKKKIAVGTCIILVLVFLVALSRKEKMPEPSYPLEEAVIMEAMEQYGFPVGLYLEENDITPYPTGSSVSYTVKNPDREVFAGTCFGILSHKIGEHRSLGITFNTLDQEENFSEEEIRKALRFASALFGGFVDDLQVYEKCQKKYDFSGYFFWEGKMEGIDCQVIYTPDSMIKLRISFATDIDMFVHPEKS